MVAMLIGCGLRRAELLALRVESIQQREEHWVGKGGEVDQRGCLASQAVERFESLLPAKP
jgi:integrase